MTSACSKYIYTSIGRIEVVYEDKRYSEAVKYCEESGQQLASLKSDKIVNEVKSKLLDCISNEGKTEFRKTARYHLGFNCTDNVLKWADGEIFDDSKYLKEYIKDDKIDGTQFSFLCDEPSKYSFSVWMNFPDLRVQPVTDEKPFLCLSSGGPNIVAIVVPIISVLVLIILGLVAWKFYFQKRKVKIKPNETDKNEIVTQASK